MKIKMDKFTKDWNENENNRDKALTAFNKMTATKEEIQDSLKLMIERDGKLEEAIAKGQTLVVESKRFKQTSIQVNTHYLWRKRCYYILGISAIILVIALLVWWLV
jgi:hypothetical protein